MKGLRFWILLLLAAVPTALPADDFFDVRGFTYKRKGSGTEVRASIDFPTTGSAPALRAARLWICEVIGADVKGDVTEDNFGQILQQACDSCFDNSRGSHTLEVTWSFEDPEVVTFESTVTDVDSVRWVSEDVASFSKKDGHRIQADEIFKCGEEQIKTLMWQFRGDLPMEVGKADDLYVGDVGFIDGWIVVIGPAAGHTGAAYRIRYETAAPYLKATRHSGGYLE